MSDKTKKVEYVLNILKHKRDGFFLEIGSEDKHAVRCLITDILEKEYNWKGLVLHCDMSLINKNERKNTTFFPKYNGLNYNNKILFYENDVPLNCDYLNINTTGYHNTPYILNKLNNEILDKYKFATIMFQTNIYNTNKTNARQLSRKILKERGYIRVFSDIMSNDKHPFDDWYVHPDLVDMDYVNKEWKEICEKNLFDREKALLPATTAYIEQQKQVNSLRKEVIDINKEIRNLQEIIKGLKDQKSNLEIMIHNGGDAVKTSNSYNGRICGDSNCRGYLSNQWKCGVCDKYTCKDCNVIKESRDDINHVCKKEDVETMKLLAKDTKSCPKCKVPIFKIEGCDQMWCTECHTAFSWRTGNIETRIHNPHYYEWQRDQNNGVAPRLHGDLE